MKRARLLLADDHPIVLAGLRLVLDQPDFEVAATVEDGRALVEAVEAIQPDVIVADVTMPNLNGIDAARKIRKRHPGIKIVILSMHPDVGYATATLALGNCAYVLKSAAADELPMAIREVLSGRTFVSPALQELVARAQEAGAVGAEAAGAALTSRQREILQLLVEGRTPKEIAFALHLSPRTVEFHKYRLMEELGVHTIAELVRAALALGIVK